MKSTLKTFSHFLLSPSTVNATFHSRMTPLVDATLLEWCLLPFSLILSFIHGNLFGSRGLYTWNAWWCRTLDILSEIKRNFIGENRNICLTVIADIMHCKLNGQWLSETYFMHFELFSDNYWLDSCIFN